MTGFVWGFPSVRMLLYNAWVHMQGECLMEWKVSEYVSYLD